MHQQRLMFRVIKAELHELKNAAPGERFQAFRRKQQELSPRWAAPLYLVGAFVSFAIGVVLAFIPGPAVVFFALTAALLASQSDWVAKKFDGLELWGRGVFDRFKSRKRGASDPEARDARAPVRRTRSVTG